MLKGLVLPEFRVLEVISTRFFQRKHYSLQKNTPNHQMVRGIFAKFSLILIKDRNPLLALKLLPFKI